MQWYCDGKFVRSFTSSALTLCQKGSELSVLPRCSLIGSGASDNLVGRAISKVAHLAIRAYGRGISNGNPQAVGQYLLVSRMVC